MHGKHTPGTHTPPTSPSTTSITNALSVSPPSPQQREREQHKARHAREHVDSVDPVGAAPVDGELRAGLGVVLAAVRGRDPDVARRVPPVGRHAAHQHIHAAAVGDLERLHDARSLMEEGDGRTDGQRGKRARRRTRAPSGSIRTISSTISSSKKHHRHQHQHRRQRQPAMREQQPRTHLSEGKLRGEVFVRVDEGGVEARVVLVRVGFAPERYVNVHGRVADVIPEG